MILGIMKSHAFVTNAFICSEYFGLFQSSDYYQIHAVAKSAYFELVCNDKTKACIHFGPAGGKGTWRSPAKGTFAGISFVEDLQLKEIAEFYSKVEDSLKTMGAQEIEIVPAPQAHNAAAFAQQVFVLRSFGFEITRCDINQSLEINSHTLSERMSYGNQKRLRKCQREGLIASQLPLSGLPRVYETLRINRESKGHRLSMSLEQLEIMVDTFPENLALFGCLHGDHFASAAVCIRLSREVLYVFYWGDRPEYATYSPVVSVADAIYRYAQEQGLRILDVGTSTVDREPNFGLLEFKRGLGFSESLKLVMRKTL